MKSYLKQSSLLMLITLFLFTLSFISCNDENETEQLTPEALYQTSWRGTGHCEGWSMKDRGIGIQFIDTQKGKVNWQDYE